MRAVLQRVAEASVTVDGAVVGEIGPGFVALVGVAEGDTVDDASVVAAKIAGLRVFADEAGKMNLSVGETGGAVLVISQFTLLADVRKGRRPSFTGAAHPDDAEGLVDRVADLLAGEGLTVARGVFGAHMDVGLLNDGPVTIVIEARDGRIV